MFFVQVECGHPGGIQILPNSISAPSDLAAGAYLPPHSRRRLRHLALNALGVSPTVPHHFSKPSAAPEMGGPQGQYRQ